MLLTYIKKEEIRNRAKQNQIKTLKVNYCTLYEIGCSVNLIFEIRKEYVLFQMKRTNFSPTQSVFFFFNLEKSEIRSPLYFIGV